MAYKKQYYWWKLSRDELLRPLTSWGEEVLSFGYDTEEDALKALGEYDIQAATLVVVYEKQWGGPK